jgi:hypothetical protein
MTVALALYVAGCVFLLLAALSVPAPDATPRVSWGWLGLLMLALAFAPRGLW